MKKLTRDEFLYKIGDIVHHGHPLGFAGMWFLPKSINKLKKKVKLKSDQELRVARRGQHYACFLQGEGGEAYACLWECLSGEDFKFIQFEKLERSNGEGKVSARKDMHS